MAKSSRTISSRGYPEAKAGENTRPSESHEDVTEKAKETNQQEIVWLLTTRSLSRFVGVFRLLRSLRNTRFRRGRPERVLSLEQRRCNEAN